jgi:Xaa-Pro aminopeptidase
VGALPWQHFRALQRALPHSTFEQATSHFQRLRLLKSAEEIGFLRRGAALTDLAVEALARGARPGLSEFELAALIEGAYVPRGGGTHIHYLATTPMAHPEICVPSQHLTPRVLQAGDVLITELSAHYQGYSGQIHRPFAIGAEPTDLYRRLYDVALDAYERIADAIGPGATTEAVLDAAESIHAAGFTIYDDLVHGFGGGYLPPVVRTRQTGGADVVPFTFREHMTVVIQPNVITPDERAGLQLGQLVRVTADGVESLHGYPLRFVSCG